MILNAVEARYADQLHPNEIVDVCAGYGGLSLGIAAVTGASVSYVVENDPNAVEVLKARHPEAERLGDLKEVDWSLVRSPRWMCAGFPCQPFSDAGQRRGAADPRHLWPWILEGVIALRPDFVLLENVRGHVRRGLPEVLADLEAAGYGGAWSVVSAASVGAPHLRKRVFVLASRHLSPGFMEIKDAEWANPQGIDSNGTVALLPTPRASDVGTEGRRASEGYRPVLSQVVLPLLPTPRATDGTNGGPNQRGRRGDLAMPSVVHVDPEVWGKFAPAIDRWQFMSGHPAPETTEVGARGGQRLAPRFVEWMMGLPPGYVTDVQVPDEKEMKRRARTQKHALPDEVVFRAMTNAAAFRLLGNGVVPPQCSRAVLLLFSAVYRLLPVFVIEGLHGRSVTYGLTWENGPS